ncbi:MAG TPA: hypothetical protein VD770_05105 [Coxiellaceae bacterium]|nr:hypothetical protein [Coxiellaceae bacterium]
MNAFFSRHVDNSAVDCISWAAIFGGVVAALGVASLLNLLGLGLGLASFSFDMDSLKSLSFATVIWLIFNSVVSMFVGGWVTGLLVGKLENRIEYLLHGFLMWSLTMMLTFWVATTSVGFAVSGVLGVTQKALTAAGKGIAEVSSVVAPQVKEVIKAVTPSDSKFLKNIDEQANKIFEKAQKSLENASDNPAANSLAQEALASTNEKFSQAIEKLFTAKNQGDINSAKEAIVELLVDKGNMSQNQAEEIVSKWYERFQHLSKKAQAKVQEAKEYVATTTEKTSSILSKLAFMSLLTLIFGAVAACFGAMSSERALRNKTL